MSIDYNINANNFIQQYENITNKEVSKGTKDKINNICNIIDNNTKYECLSKILRQYSRYKILIHFLLCSDKLKISKNFKTEEGEPYFNLSYEQLQKTYSHSKATYNRNVNLFVVLGLIKKENPYNKGYYTERQQDEAYGKAVEYKKDYKLIMGKRLERDVVYELENLYYNVKYTAKRLKEAESIANVLLEKNFSIGAMSSIYISRLLGADIAGQVYFGNNYRTETNYSILLSENIKNTLIEQVENRGYATKQTIYKAVRDRGVLFCFKNTDTEKELYKHTRKSLWATFEREYKRTVDLFLFENKEYTKQMATKELKAVYSIKRNQYVIYKRKDFENKLNEYRKRGCK